MALEKGRAIHPFSTAPVPRRRRFLSWRSVPAWCAIVLAFSIAANAFAFVVLKKIYADYREAAVFPASGGSALRESLPKSGRRIILFGDSRAAQWMEFPTPRGAELVVSAVPGETTAQMRMRFEADVLARQPDIVVMQMGINDLVTIGVLPGRREEIVSQCEANVRYFLDALLQRNVRTILFTIIPAAQPPLWRRPFWNEAINIDTDAINGRWLALARPPLLEVLDSRALLQDAQGRWHDGVNADTLHLASGGYKRLNAAIGPILLVDRDPNAPPAVSRALY